MSFENHEDDGYSEKSVLKYFEEDKVGISDDMLSITVVEVVNIDAKKSEDNIRPVDAGNILPVTLNMSGYSSIICLQ
jgi:hypothetical protein